MSLYINKKSQIMRRFQKLLWMIFIFWVVFFIICDEKWYKIWLENNQIFFSKTEKKSDLFKDEALTKNTVYKNSDLVHLNYEFENPKTLRKSDGMDPKYLAKLEQEKEKKRLEQEKQEKRLEQKKREKIIENDKEEEKLKEEKSVKTEKVYTWPNIVAIKDTDSISSMFQWLGNTKQNTWTTKQETKQNTWTTKQETKQDTWTMKQEIKQNTWTTKQEIKQNTWTTSKDAPQKPIVYYPVDKFRHSRFTLNLNKWVEIPKVKIDKYFWGESLSLNLHNGKIFEPKILYKNSNKIKIYSWFENPKNMRISAGLDEKFLVKQENSKPTSISLNNDDSISNAWKENLEFADNLQNIWNDSGGNKQNISANLEGYAQFVDTWINNFKVNKSEWNNEEILDTIKVDEAKEQKITSKVDKYEHINHQNNMKKWKEPENVLAEVNKYEHENSSTDVKESTKIENISLASEVQENYISIVKPDFSKHSINISEWKETEITTVKIDVYQLSKHKLSLKKWKFTKHNFIVENTEDVESQENWLSDPILESLLENEEIDINTLESENDEFLQKVFEQTKDRDVMNLIVETYLNEYQFVKAKRFIENLPEMYRNELKPSLNLRVAFNSFPLSSKTINENLNTIVQNYSSKNEISTEDKNRYLWVIALLDRNYDKFFEISTWFTSEKYSTFTSKLQWYKEQIAKQMWMPDYYFDTLVSLELFNKWLFQPAKVLALYSLQQNSNYILPYQVLAYANFLTNSWDTSVEYLKKLVDLDPNNAEKYRFLMWVAFYRDEKYEQSVVMLSMIKDEKLRLDTQRYLINDYLKLDQKNKLISTWNKLLGSENLVASDFYTYFYETFFRPYSEWAESQLYAYDTELANKMLRVCSITLQNEEKAVCTYWTIGRNIAMWQFDGLEQYLLDLVAEYPQWYLYQALWDYYIQQWDLEKAKVYLIKAISLTQNKSERSQIKKLLQDTM